MMMPSLNSPSLLGLALAGSLALAGCATDEDAPDPNVVRVSAAFTCDGQTISFDQAAAGSLTISIEDGGLTFATFDTTVEGDNFSGALELSELDFEAGSTKRAVFDSVFVVPPVGIFGPEEANKDVEVALDYLDRDEKLVRLRFRGPGFGAPGVLDIHEENVSMCAGAIDGFIEGTYQLEER